MTLSPRGCPRAWHGAHAARSGPMLHPSRGGRGRPHEGHARAGREPQPGHLAARRTGDKRSKIGCAAIPVSQCRERGKRASGAAPDRALVALVNQSTLSPAAPLVASAQLIPIRFHLGELVLRAGEQTAKARCDSVERCSGSVPSPPPRPTLQIHKQTHGPPSHSSRSRRALPSH